MSKKVITTKRCPCCKYEYQETRYFKDVEVEEERVISKIRNGKEIADRETLEMANISLNINGVLLATYKKTCKIIKKKVLKENAVSNKEVTKGDEDFIKLEAPSENDIFGGDPIPVNYLGMFCPRCGIFMNIDICTTIEEEEL